MRRIVECGRRAHVLLGLLAVLAASLSFGAGPALGALSFPFATELAPTSGSFAFLESNSVAVDDFNDDTYVADSGAATVFVFAADGHELATLDGTSTPAGSFGGGGLAVAANNSNGRVYVLDSASNVVDVFSSGGSYECQVTAAASPSATECNGALGSTTPSGGFSAPRGLAVDQATGDIYVLDAENLAVDVFGEGGAYKSTIDLGTLEVSIYPPLTRGIAVSGFSGHVYIGEDLNSQVLEFDGAGGYVTTWTGSNTPAGGFGGEVSVAVDDASGRIYVTDVGHEVTDVFDSAGEYLTQFAHSYEIAGGTALDQGSGQILVSNDGSAPVPTVVDVFGPAAVIPDVTTEAATGITPTSATLQGTTNPRGIQATGCFFEYGSGTEYGQRAQCVPSAAEIPADEGEHSVTAEVKELNAGATYHYRLVVENANGANAGADTTVSTPPRPSIEDAVAEHLTATTADLTVDVNPEGSETTVYFEWGLSSAYGERSADFVLSASNEANVVTQSLKGLVANVSYHWRVVATNANGTTIGVDHSFIYDTLTRGLPDRRAYEMVTPVQKNGAVIGAGFLIGPPDVAANGDRLMISSIQCFAETPSCTAVRQLEGEPYSFTRGSGGWIAKALAPPVSVENANSSWLVSADLGTALFSMASAPGEQDDFVVRGSNGAFLDIGPATWPGAGAIGPAFGESVYVATPDFSHIAYELSKGMWPFDASLHVSVYEYSGPSGAPALVGVTGGEGSTSLISQCGSRLAGSSGEHPLSADGSRVFFIALGHDGGEVACPSATPAPATSELYARVGGTSTIALSQRSSLDCTGACATSSASDAKFEDASSDGERVYFTDTQQLTDDASAAESATDTAAGGECRTITHRGGCNLYLYDFEAPAGHNLVAASAGDTSGLGPQVQQVVAVSADGSHAYFLARGVLTTVANSQGETAIAGAENLYVFERDASHPTGRVTFIATVSASDGEAVARREVVPDVTPDGRYLVFVSRAQLTRDDTSASNAAQIFRYDALEDSLVRISVGDQGFNDDGNSLGQESCQTACPLDASIARMINGSRRDPTMSDDGSFVFFKSPVGLTPHALDRVQIGKAEHGQPLYAENIYEYHDGRVYLITDGKDKSGLVELLGSDASGVNVFFSTVEQLVPGDTDTERDYYDARIGGGFPVPQLREACEDAEGCRPGGSAETALATPGSVTSSDAGNVVRRSGAAGAGHAKKLTRAQQLVRALRACHTQRTRAKRRGCEARARKRYGAPSHRHLQHGRKN